MHRLHHHGQHRDQDPDADETLKKVMHFPAIGAVKDDGMNFLPEGSAPVQANELMVGGDDHPEQLQDPKQPQEPQHA